MDNDSIKVLGLLPPLREKLNIQKRKIQIILSKPKSERNKNRLKTLLKETKNLRKILKNYSKQNIEVCCPKCGHSFSNQNE